MEKRKLGGKDEQGNDNKHERAHGGIAFDENSKPSDGSQLDAPARPPATGKKLTPGSSRFGRHDFMKI